MIARPGLARRLARDTRAVSAVEFALILPLLALFSLGTIEVSRLVLLTQKLQSAAYTLADLAARIDREGAERTETLRNVFLAIDQVVKPFDFETLGNSIVTGVGSPTGDDAPEVSWQCGGSGGLIAASRIGKRAHAAALPAGLDIRKGETIVAAEVYFEFRPVFGAGIVSERVIRRVAFFKPRLGEAAAVACPTA